MGSVKSFARLFAVLLMVCALAAAARAQTARYLDNPLDPQYPPYNQYFNQRHNLSPPIIDKLLPTVPVPGQWPYFTSYPYIQGWAYPNWWPYSAKWDYNDRFPYYESWTYSDWLAYEQRWKYGDTPLFSDRWAFPANWPHPTRWSPIDQWAPFTRWASTADIGVIDMINDKNEAIAFGDYTFLLDVGDKLYITRAQRLLGVARVTAVTESYASLQAVRTSHDYFFQQGDTFQLMGLPPAVQEEISPRVNLMLDDGRFVSYNDFVPRDYWRGDFFTLRRNGQNVGTARLVTVGYGYALLEPAESTVPQIGDVLIHREAPQPVDSILKSRTISSDTQIGMVVREGPPDGQLLVESADDVVQQRRGSLKKLKKQKDWPDTDIWWEDTYLEDERE